MSALGVRRAVRDGILVEVFNVKTALFFLAFLPQFLVPGQAATLQLAVMGTACVVLNTLVDLLAVLGAHRLLQSQRARRRRERVLTKASGLTMLGLGLYVATTRSVACLSGQADSQAAGAGQASPAASFIASARS